MATATLTICVGTLFPSRCLSRTAAAQLVKAGALVTSVNSVHLGTLVSVVLV